MNIPLTADSRTTKDKFFSYVEAKGLGASLLIGCKFNSNAGKAEAIERIQKALRRRQEHDGDVGRFNFTDFRETLPLVDTMAPTPSPLNPFIGNFDPNVLPGSALLCIAHSSLTAKSVFSLPSTLLTYTKPGHNLSVRDAESALKRMDTERRIVKNVGEFHVLPNSDVTPNYALVGDSHIPCVGLYKITPGCGVNMLERWHSDDKYDIEKMYQLASKHECNHVVVLACKS